MKYEYFTVKLENVNSEQMWSIKGLETTKDYWTLDGAFNYLGSIKARLRMQTKAGVFIFERPLSDGDKLIRCSGCWSEFTRDKVVYVENLPYCRHCLNDERMDNDEAFNGLQTCRGCKDKFSSDKIQYFDSDPYCGRCIRKVDKDE